MTQDPARHLSEAVEHIRAFNHASMSTGEGWQYPPHTYRALGNLSQLAGMLGQALGQALIPVAATHRNGRVAMDGDESADDEVVELMRYNEHAQTAIGVLTHTLRQMHSTASPMGLDTTGLLEFDDDDA